MSRSIRLAGQHSSHILVIYYTWESMIGSRIAYEVQWNEIHFQWETICTLVANNSHTSWWISTFCLFFVPRHSSFICSRAVSHINIEPGWAPSSHWRWRLEAIVGQMLPPCSWGEWSSRFDRRTSLHSPATYFIVQYCLNHWHRLNWSYRILQQSEKSTIPPNHQL